MSEEEMRDIRKDIRGIAVEHAETKTIVSSIRSDVSEIKEALKIVSEWRGSFRVLIWIATAISAVLASISTNYFGKH